MVFGMIVRGETAAQEVNSRLVYVAVGVVEERRTVRGKTKN